MFFSQHLKNSVRDLLFNNLLEIVMSIISNRIRKSFVFTFIIFLVFMRVGGGAQSLDFKSLQVNRTVRVIGKYLHQGIFVSDKVEIIELNDFNFLQGKITNLRPEQRTLHIFGIEVKCTDSTQLLTNDENPLTITGFSPGDWVLIEGKYQTSLSRFIATKIQQLGRTTKNSQEYLQGPVQRLGKGKWQTCLLLGVPVVIDKAAKIIDNRRPRELPARSIKRDDDDQQPTPRTLGKFITLGGKAELEVAPQENFDLSEAASGREIKSALAFKPEIAVAFHPDVEGYTKLKLKRKPLFNGGGKRRNSTTSFEASELYLTYHILGSDWQLRFGRQRFKDKREWLFDENLDAVRLHYKGKRLNLQLAYIDGLVSPQDDLDDAINQKHLYLATRSKLARRTYLSGYLLVRQHHHRNESMNWFGLSTRGQLSSFIRFWGNIAAVFGTDEEKDVQGFGYDLGIKLTTNSPKPVSALVGFAYGSGDANPDDNTDLSFRQTGLHDNGARLNGLKRVKYYGVVLEPELSNIRIWTVGAGWHPTVKSSLEVVYHRYRQVTPLGILRDANIDAQPAGISPELGEEVDIFFVLREISNIDVTLGVGYFRPGAAFGETHANVLMGNFGIQFFY